MPPGVLLTSLGLTLTQTRTVGTCRGLSPSETKGRGSLFAFALYNVLKWLTKTDTVGVGESLVYTVRPLPRPYPLKDFSSSRLGTPPRVGVHFQSSCLPEGFPRVSTRQRTVGLTLESKVGPGSSFSGNVRRRENRHGPDSVESSCVE